MKKRIGLSLLAGMVLLLPTAPAQALLSVRYDGTVLLQFDTSTGQSEPGAMNGNFGYSAIFYYGDLGEHLAASLIVADVLRAHYTMCQHGYPEASACLPLTNTPTSIGSNTGTTPEDFISMGVYSPGGFGGVPFSGPRRRSYDVVPADTTNAQLSWALFDNASGFAWNSGSGSISRVTTAVPEPASWLLMFGGFGIIGALLRRRPKIARVCA